MNNYRLFIILGWSQMLESIQNDFEYEKLSAEEQQRRGILGRLKGIIADFKNPTRNGRLYG